MLRWIRIPLGLVLILSVTGGTARAQYGWGWGGWGGWGETPQGSIARGLGALYAGEGMYNQQTAVARSINEDTWQRWNQYLYLLNEEATRKYLTKKNFDIQKNKDSYNSIIKRLQDAPTARDLDDGDALNAALDQLSDPRIQSSSLRVATEQVPANIVAQIPFRYASEAVTIIMSNLKGANQWPPALDIARFAAEKREFEDVAEQARKEDEDGEISPQTIRRANNLVAILRSKLAEQPLADSRDDLAAQRFLKTVAGLVKLLEKPDTKEVLDQLRMVKTPVTIAQPDRVHARLQSQVCRGCDASAEDDLPRTFIPCSTRPRQDRQGRRPRREGRSQRRRRLLQQNETRRFRRQAQQRRAQAAQAPRIKAQTPSKAGNWAIESIRCECGWGLSCSRLCVPLRTPMTIPQPALWPCSRSAGVSPTLATRTARR